MQAKKILIIGAGLSGSLMAAFLAKKNYEVTLIEARNDMRKAEQKGGRSINLALSHRGIKALSKIGLSDAILRHAVPMLGRMMHSTDGRLHYAPYSTNADEYINSISRAELNEILLSTAENSEKVSLFFDEKCVRANVETGEAWTSSSTRPDGELKAWKADIILGTDGANSALRDAFPTVISDFKSTTQWESHGYKELTILPTENGGFHMDKNALHIWARQTYMMIALPNHDGSFTCTLFMPMEGENSFEELNTAAKISDFFAAQFADALPLVPDLLEQWARNPVGRLGTLRCNAYSYADKAALMGDAAHAIVPFYGQGMNASFEDCLCLDDLLEKYNHDWAKVLAAYQNQRKPNSDAIATLAQENFIEMRDHVANPIFVRKRQLELAIEQAYPDYHSKYALVTFHPEVPYTEAHRRGNAQDALLMEICSQENPDLDLVQIYQRLSEI